MTGRISVAFLLVVLASDSLGAQGDEVSRARALAFGGKHVEATALLHQYLASEPSDTDARTLLGTVLSWDGRYDEARTELQTVISGRPTDGDALPALINVELWSDHPQQAKVLAERGLAAATKDDRYLEGRERAISAIDYARAWAISASYSYDWFSDQRSAWRESQASLKRQTPVGSIIARGSRAERFSVMDNQFEIEMYPSFRPGTYAYVSFGIAPDQRLYPHYRYAADIYQSLGKGFEASIGFRRLRFSSDTDIYVGTLSKYVGNWLLTGRMYYVPDRTGANSRSYHGSFRRYFGGAGTSYVGARYSRGFAREEIRNINDFEVLNSETAAGELDVNLSRRWRLGLSGSTSRQDRLDRDALRQNSASATLGFRF